MSERLPRRERLVIDLDPVEPSQSGFINGRWEWTVDEEWETWSHDPKLVHDEVASGSAFTRRGALRQARRAARRVRRAWEREADEANHGIPA